MKFRDFHPNVQIRIVVSFVTLSMYNMVIPFMSVYFAQRMGATSTGLILVISIIAGTVSSVYGGYYADAIGRKKLMLLAELLSFIAYAGMAIFNSPWMESPSVTFVMMVLANVCWGIYGPSSDAMLLDVTLPEQRKFMYSIMYWSNNLAIALGGAVGAILFKDYLFELFTALVIVTTLSYIVTLLFIEETYFPIKVPVEEKGNRKMNGFQDLLSKYRAISKDKTFMIFVLGSILLLSVEFHLTNYIGIRLAEQMPVRPLLSIGNLILSIDGIKMLGFLRTENTLLVVLLSLFVTKVLQKYSDKQVLVVGFVFYVFGYSLISYSNQPWVLMAAMLLATWGEVMHAPVTQAYLGDIAPEHARSAYMAVYRMAFKGALFISAIGVMLGGILPTWIMSALIFITGISGIVLYYSILPRLDERKAAAVPLAHNSRQSSKWKANNKKYRSNILTWSTITHYIRINIRLI